VFWGPSSAATHRLAPDAAGSPDVRRARAREPARHERPCRRAPPCARRTGRSCRSPPPRTFAGAAGADALGSFCIARSRPWGSRSRNRIGGRLGREARVAAIRRDPLRVSLLGRRCGAGPCGRHGPAGRTSGCPRSPRRGAASLAPGRRGFRTAGIREVVRADAPGRSAALHACDVDPVCVHHEEHR